ncbi:MAG: hypothetical protein M1840_002563 [Geoglossum simile]|nr:MAG: hypothetical protein M1840_002563 [Geoglossum simile]
MSDNPHALTQCVPAEPHTILVSPALLKSIAQEAENDADLAAEGNVARSDDEVISWNAADECGCVACEDIEATGDITIPPEPADWGKDKDHWFCTNVRQKDCRTHQLRAKWIQACLIFLDHPGKEEVDFSTKNVATFVEEQGLSF